VHCIGGGATDTMVHHARRPARGARNDDWGVDGWVGNCQWVIIYVVKNMTVNAFIEFRVSGWVEY